MSGRLMSNTGILYLIGLLVFLGSLTLAAYQLAELRTQRLMQDAHDKSREDLQLIRAFLQPALQEQNYQALEGILKELGRLRRDTLEIRLTAANGFVLAEFHRDVPNASVYSTSDVIAYSHKGRAKLEFVDDLSAVNARLRNMRLELVAAAGVIGVFFTIMLWEAYRRRREAVEVGRKTEDLQLANQRLKSALLAKEQMRTYVTDVLDAMPSILIGVDRDARITEWNKGAEAYARIKREDALSLTLTDLMPQLREQFHNIRSTIDSGKTDHSSRISTVAGGTMRYSEISVHPASADAGAGAIIRVDDVTQRVRFEQMMIQTEKVTALSGLAAGVAHEINSPLSGVLQNCQNIQRRLSPELSANHPAALAAGIDLHKLERYLRQRKIPDFLHMVKEAAERASQIVADMLAFSQRSTEGFEKTAVEELLETAIRLSSSDIQMKKTLGFRRIELIREFAPSLPLVHCDRPRIEQVLLNLLKNATQAMVEANTPFPRTITLRTRGDKEHVTIEVEDNGPGMSEDVAHRIFDPFYSTKGPGWSNGLGLAVAHFIIAEQHRGSIEVESTLGIGTCFILRLPAKSDSDNGISGFSSLKNAS